MTKGREFTTAAFATLAVLACLSVKAEAAQCCSTPAGFEAWKREFAEQAKAKGISASAVAALMQATYAAATIARRSRPEKLQSVARSVSHQARGVGHSRARAFA